ncbi:MAG: amidohydrolase family protein [Xanthobacteraceae bacterium]
MTTRIERRYSFRGCVCCDQPANIPAGPALSRRSVLGGAAALGFSAATGFAPRRSLAQAPSASSGKAHRIDVHHHIAPPKYVTEFKSELQPPVIAWSVSKSLDDMDKSGVATAITSVTTPGSVFTGKDGRRVARECNEFAARLVQDHPGRFGMFVALPLTDVEGSLREIEFGLDVLKADGVAVFTSYGDVWLGDPKFEPIMAELNRRKAVIYTHPDAPICCRDPMVPEIREPVIEYGTDTTRAIARVLFSGTAVRYRDVRWIFSHGGGTAPFLAERLIRTPSLNKKLVETVPNGAMAELQRFYYDVAQIAHPAPLAALAKFVPASQILWGTDYPFRFGNEYVKALAEFGFSAGDLSKIDRENALALLPRLRAG